jgi:hypothetical protein
MRAASLSLVVLIGALVLPATAAAAGGYYTVTLNAECGGVAGDGWHAAIIKLKAKVVARGTTPADYLQIRSVAQRQRNDGSWLVVERLIPDAYSSFTPDGTTHTLQFGNSFGLPATFERHGDKAHRLKFTLTAYGGSMELFKDTISRTCVN